MKEGERMLENITVISIATSEESDIPTTDWLITSTPFVNEQQQVAQLHQQILELEKAESVDESQIVSLKSVVETLIFEVEEKQMFMRRLHSLETLNRVTEILTTELTLKEAQLWQVRLANVGKSTKKQVLTQQLKMKVAALQETAQQTQKELWISELVRKKHNAFINLTAPARAEILKELANNEASLEHIDQYINRLKEKIVNLKEELDVDVFIKNLEKLPLKSFESYSADEKEYVARKLMEQPTFDTIRSLEAVISKAYNAYQLKGRIKLTDGTEGTMILLEDDVNQLINQSVILK